MDSLVRGNIGLRSGGGLSATHQLDLYGTDSEIRGGQALAYYYFQTDGNDQVFGNIAPPTPSPHTQYTRIGPCTRLCARVTNRDVNSGKLQAIYTCTRRRRHTYTNNKKQRGSRSFLAHTWCTYFALPRWHSPRTPQGYGKTYPTLPSYRNWLS